MYQKHPEFEEPADDTILWRYVDFTKFISYLEKNALFFVRSDQFPDKYEGKFTKKDVLAWKEKLQPHAKLSQIEMYERLRKSVHISSWHINENESAAMWEICLRSGEGVAIKSTFKRLKDSFIYHKEDDIYIGKVHYIDYTKNTIPQENIFKPFVYKRKAFEHEKELRAVIIKPSFSRKTVENPNFTYIHPKWLGIHVATDLEILIDKIIVSPDVPDWFIDLVTSLVKKFELNKKVSQSELSREPPY